MNEAGADSAVTIISVAIGATAVIVAAIIAAVTAQKRLNRSLAEERKRLQEQLDAESARLEQQLAHDRELREVEGLRQIFDASLAAIAKARIAVSLYLTTEDFSQLEHEFVPPIREASLVVDRLVLRLGLREPVVRAYRQLFQSVRELRDASRAYVEWQPPSATERAVLPDSDSDLATRTTALEAARVDVGSRWEAYVTAARALVATRLQEVDAKSH